MRYLSISLIAVAIALASFGALAQGGQKGGQIDRKAVRDAIHKLKSPNPEEVLMSIQLLAASGSSDAVGPLTDLLRTGPRNDITNASIQALGSIGARPSVAILLEYLEHRRPDARVAALYALESMNDPRVTAAIENRLRDSDAQVRSTAALSLGKRNSKSSVNILFQAFDRGVHDAAIAIGQIGGETDAVRLGQYLGKADMKVLLPGFDEFLRRKDFPEKGKLKIMEQLFELAGPDVRRFAVAYKASFPQGTEEDSNALFKMVSRMVRQIAEE